MEATEIPGPLDHKRYQEPVETPEPAPATTFKQRIMNRVQRRREGWSNRHATPAVRTRRPPHRIQWSTETDQRLVLDAIRLGLVGTGTGKPVWGKNGIFRTRKALFVAVTQAKAAGWPVTPEREAMASALSKHWSGA